MNASNSSHNCACSSVTALHVLNMFLDMEKYFGPPLLIFGIVCNILAILTLRQPKLKESPFIHLMGLTVSDLLALILILIDHYLIPGSKSSVIYVCYVYYPLSNIAASFCVWIMVVMTLERCIFMQFPLWAPIWCTNSTAKLKIALIFLVSCVVNFPRFFWYKTNLPEKSSHNNVSSNMTIQGASLLNNIENNLNGSHFAVVLTWVYSIILCFLPVIILLMLNTFLIYKIRANQRRRNQLRIHNHFEPVRTQEQTRLTITLIAITGLYVILILPSAFADNNIASILFKEYKIQLKLFQHVSNFLQWINLSFNFLMYTFINVKFMRAFKRMISKWFLIIQKRIHPKIHKMDSTRAQKGGGGFKEFQLRRYPAQNLTGRRSHRNFPVHDFSVRPESPTSVAVKYDKSNFALRDSVKGIR